MAANSKSDIELVFGGGSVRRSSVFGNESTLKNVFETLKENGIKRIDTAHLYGDSEKLLGNASAGNYFIIDSKIKGGFSPGSARKDKVIEGATQSLERLNIEKLGIFYIHAPDYEVPIAETLEGINEVFKNGLFERFGISNYKPGDVEYIYNHCKMHGYPVPTVYQGNYSPIARKLESNLLPTLRRLGISFYVYSPLAGGFLTKTKDDILNGVGRFNEISPGGNMYTTMYKKPAYMDILADWEEIASLAGCSKAELAYRWVAYNSQLNAQYGDGLLIGANSLQQLNDTLENLKKGPLNPEIAKQVDGLWTKLESVAPLDNFHL